jgi:hypothetical protein
MNRPGEDKVKRRNLLERKSCYEPKDWRQKIKAIYGREPRVVGDVIGDAGAD